MGRCGKIEGKRLVMSKCRVVGAGEFNESNILVEKDDFLIAADGGYAHLVKLQIVPDLLIGDFDSLSEQSYPCPIIKSNPIKDDTDLSLAISEGMKRGYTEFVVYGALGGRLEHSLANIQLMYGYLLKGAHITIVDGSLCLRALMNQTLDFDESYAGYISVFAYDEVVLDLIGFKYELHDYVLTNSHPLGIDNEFMHQPSQIVVKKGALFIIYYE